MSNNPMEVYVAVYEKVDQAKGVLADLQKMHKDGIIELIDAAVLEKNAEGKVSVLETAEFTPKKGVVTGSIAGILVGLLFPPAVLASGVLGAGVGALVGKLTDRGLFDNTELQELANELEPGNSAIMAVMDDKWVEQFEKVLKGYTKLANHGLDATAAADIMV